MAHAVILPSPQPEDPTDDPLVPIWRRDSVSNPVPAAAPRLLADIFSEELQSPTPSKLPLRRTNFRRKHNDCAPSSPLLPRLWRKPEVRNPPTFVDASEHHDIMGLTNDSDVDLGT